MQKRGAITLFMAGGILLIIVISFVIVATSQSVKKTMKREIEKFQNQFSSSQSIKSFVEFCVEDNAKKGIKILSKQGGNIFQSQDGPIADLPALNGVVKVVDNYNVPFAIQRNVAPDELGKKFNSNLPPLRIVNEPINDLQSVEYQLEYFINKKINEEESCLDFKEFEGQGYRIEELSQREIDVEIGANDIKIKFIYPIKIETGKETLNLNEFHSRLNIGFNRVYDVANTLIEEEQNGNLIEGIPPGQFENMEIEVIEAGQREGFKDDLIVIKDKSISFEGRDYEFQFMREMEWEEPQGT